MLYKNKEKRQKVPLGLTKPEMNLYNIVIVINATLRIYSRPSGHPHLHAHGMRIIYIGFLLRQIIIQFFIPMLLIMIYQFFFEI